MQSHKGLGDVHVDSFHSGGPYLIRLLLHRIHRRLQTYRQKTVRVEFLGVPYRSDLLRTHVGTGAGRKTFNHQACLLA
jgi:hypothetical protein